MRRTNAVQVPPPYSLGHRASMACRQLSPGCKAAHRSLQRVQDWQIWPGGSSSRLVAHQQPVVPTAGDVHRTACHPTDVESSLATSSNIAGLYDLWY
jgi:hypothetical protein